MGIYIWRNEGERGRRKHRAANLSEHDLDAVFLPVLPTSIAMRTLLLISDLCAITNPGCEVPSKGKIHRGKMKAEGRRAEADEAPFRQSARHDNLFI